MTLAANEVTTAEAAEILGRGMSPTKRWLRRYGKPIRTEPRSRGMVRIYDREALLWARLTWMMDRLRWPVTP